MAHTCLSQTQTIYPVDTIMLTNVKDHLFHLDLTIYAAYQLKKALFCKTCCSKKTTNTHLHFLEKLLHEQFRGQQGILNPLSRWRRQKINQTASGMPPHSFCLWTAQSRHYINLILISFLPYHYNYLLCCVHCF